MTKGIESKNSGAQPTIRQFLGLSGAQFLLDLLIASLMLALINTKDIWHYFNDTVLASQQATMSGVIGQNANWLDKLLHGLSQSRVPQVVFWVLMGCAVYIIVWITRTLLNNMRNDFVASHFVRSNPRENTAGSFDYWRPILLRKTFFAAILAVLVGFIFTAFKLVRTLADLCKWAISNFQPFQSTLEIVSALLAVTILLQILLILGLITIRSWKSVNNDL